MKVQSILLRASEALDDGNMGEAERLLNLAAAEDKNCSLAYYNLALIAEEAGDLAKAAEQLEKALAIKSDDTDFLAAMGTVQLKIGQIDKAETFFSKALEIEENEVACNNLGTIHFERKDYRKAKEFYKRALAVNPDYPEARENMALANFYLEML